MSRYFILNTAGEPELASLEVWMASIGKGAWRLAEDTCGPWQVLTIFTGMAAGDASAAAPVLFETSVLGEDGPVPVYFQGYTHRNLALKGHRATFAVLQARHAQASATLQQLLDCIASRSRS